MLRKGSTYAFIIQQEFEKENANCENITAKIVEINKEMF